MSHKRQPLHIDTAHLRLQAHVPEHLLVLIEHPDNFQKATGFAAAPGLREFFVSGDVSPAFLEALRTMHEPDAWRLGYAVVLRQSQTIIGTASFRGEPDANGMVEIAYGIVPGFEGRGYATEAANGLVDYAFKCAQVRRILAHTLPFVNASTRVLTKCGFQWTDELDDPEDGAVWRWEYGGL
jgi:RimJ/RimL family protein N-acetyltransferase